MEPVPVMKKINASPTSDRRTASFTLIELLVVTAIVSILLAMLVPALQSTKERAMRMKCLNNVRQVGIAIEFYKEDNEAFYPVREPNAYDFGDMGVYMTILGSNYFRSNWGVFKCPSSRNVWDINRRTNTLGGQMDYQINSGVWSMQAGGKNQFNQSAYILDHVVVLYDWPGPNWFGYALNSDSPHRDGGINAYFLDGHASWISLAGAAQVIDGKPNFYEWGLK